VTQVKTRLSPFSRLQFRIPQAHYEPYEFAYVMADPPQTRTSFCRQNIIAACQRRPPGTRLMGHLRQYVM